MRKLARPGRLIPLIGVHVMFIVLAANCGPNSVGHGSYYLTVPNNIYGDMDLRDVEFFLDEPVGEGTITGYVTATRCELYVSICDGFYCEDIFYSPSLDGTAYIDVSSNDSPVFQSFLDDFVPCYKDNEFASEPFSCQRWNCDDSKREITVVLESLDHNCPATLVTEMDVEYLDVRVPFLALCGACVVADDSGACEGYDCQDLNQEF